MLGKGFDCYISIFNVDAADLINEPITLGGSGSFLKINIYCISVQYFEVVAIFSSPFLRSLKGHMLVRRYSLRTIKSYLYWVKCYILFSGKTHPENISEQDFVAFQGCLAVERKVSVAMQTIALDALVDFYIDRWANLDIFVVCRGSLSYPLCMLRMRWQCFLGSCLAC